MKGLGYGTTFGLLLFVVPVLCGAASGSTHAQAPEAKPSPPPAAASFDASDCQSCHPAAVEHMARTPHARVEGGCTACHGDVSAHVKGALEGGEPGPIRSMKKMTP